MDGKRFPTDGELDEICMRSDSEQEFAYDISSEEDNNDDESTCDSGKSDDELEELQRKRRKPTSKEYGWTDTTSFNPTIHPFNDMHSGTSSGNASSTELECFKLFFTEEIVTEIAKQTNLYFQFVDSENLTKQKSRLKRWKDTDYKEMYCFFAMNLLMSQVKKPCLNNYWSQDWLQSTPAFAQIMSRDRYLLLLRLIHFTDNTTPPISGDSLSKIRIIVEYIKNKFRENFIPYQNICIDESILLFKGRLFFKQYVPSKRHRFGIKFFVMCDCKTGYILDFIIYTGSTTEIIDSGIANVGKTGNIVLTLINPYLNKGHTLYVDNWYSSPALFSYLFEKKTNACGTVKANRKNMPVLNKKLKAGDVESKATKNLLAIKWHDKRDVRVLSTLHIDELIPSNKIDKNSGENVLKPACILDYNKNMGSVDRSDMMLSSTETVRKTLKWYKKTFFHLFDLAVLNSSILHKHLTKGKQSVGEFQNNLIKQILAAYHTPQQRNQCGRRPETANSELRLTARHFPTFLPATESKSNPTRRCIVCTKKQKRKESRYICEPCNVSLCVIPCFQDYHTKKNY